MSFERRGDRFEHVVSVLRESSGGAPFDAPAETSLLASRAGAADDPWPASPPFTGAHVERRGASQVAFLVGLAGDSHWSASVEIDELTGTLNFDLACRARSRPQWLGSSYRLLAATADESSVALRWTAPAALVLEIDPQAGPAALVRMGADSVAVVPTVPPELSFPATIRWRYVVRRNG